MSPAPAAYGFQQLNMEILRGIVDAIGDRPGDTEAQRFARAQSIVFWVMAFLPRDPVETMLAGQCVVFDHVLRDGARDLLRGQSEPIKLKVRPQLNATGNMVLKTLTHLNRLQARPAEGAVPAAAPADPAKAVSPGPLPPQAVPPRAGSAAPAQPAPQPVAPPVQTRSARAPAPETAAMRGDASVPEAPVFSARSLRCGVSLTAMALAFRGADHPLPADWDFGAAVGLSPAADRRALPGAA